MYHNVNHVFVGAPLKFDNIYILVLQVTYHNIYMDGIIQKC